MVLVKIKLLMLFIEVVKMRKILKLEDSG